MKFPNVTVLAGKDLNVVTTLLTKLNVKFKVCNMIQYNKCKLILDEFSIEQFNLKDLHEGMQLYFFKNVAFELNLNVSWEPQLWDHNIDGDVYEWFKEESVVKMTIAKLLSHTINHEEQMLSIYKDSLLATFKHPQIQCILEKCITRKLQHLNLWLEAKQKLTEPNAQVQKCTKTWTKCTTLSQTIQVLTEAIGMEENVETSALELLTHFNNRGKLCEFFKAVKTRNNESFQHSQILQTLLNEMKRLFIFLDSTIVNDLKSIRYKVNLNKEHFFELLSLSLISDSY